MLTSCSLPWDQWWDVNNSSQNPFPFPLFTVVINSESLFHNDFSSCICMMTGDIRWHKWDCETSLINDSKTRQCHDVYDCFFGNFLLHGFSSLFGWWMYPHRECSSCWCLTTRNEKTCHPRSLFSLLSVQLDNDCNTTTSGVIIIASESHALVLSSWECNGLEEQDVWQGQNVTGWRKHKERKEVVSD